MSLFSPAADVVPDPQAVTQLLRDQAPHLAELPVQPSPASGSSNWVFRIGDGLAIRLPRSETSQQGLLARSLGDFHQRLHEIDTAGVPAGPEHWGFRCGAPVTDTMDRWADHAAAELADLSSPASVREAWRRLRDVPAATEATCWVHTDLSEENLLVHPDGRRAGVIDFGGIGVGDRSVDLLYAWSVFDAPAREVLRAVSGADVETWTRARAWAFVGPGLLTIASYRHTLPSRVDRLTSMVETIAGEVDIQLP